MTLCCWTSRPAAWTAPARTTLSALAAELARAGAAVVVATHDVRVFAAAFADRVVLMGRGEVVANGPARELLAGGWYFSTEVARLLSGAAATPAEGSSPTCTERGAGNADEHGRGNLRPARHPRT